LHAWPIAASEEWLDMVHFPPARLNFGTYENGKRITRAELHRVFGIAVFDCEAIVAEVDARDALLLSRWHRARVLIGGCQANLITAHLASDGHGARPRFAKAVSNEFTSSYGKAPPHIQAIVDKLNWSSG
jgi:hypothetical protein